MKFWHFAKRVLQSTDEYCLKLLPTINQKYFSEFKTLTFDIFESICMKYI